MVRMTVVPDRVERADEHGPEPVPEEERELREDHPGDEDRSANRPQSAQIVLQSRPERACRGRPAESEAIRAPIGHDVEKRELVWPTTSGAPPNTLEIVGVVGRPLRRSGSMCWRA